MTNILVGIIILAIISSSAVKILSEKKKGSKCIGCPYSKASSNNCSCSSHK